MSADPAFLEQEGAALCRGLFGLEAPPGCAQAYARAQTLVQAAPAGRSGAVFSEALRRGWDLEALELAWRGRDRANPLTLKAHTLFYLLEARPESYPSLVAERAEPARAWAWLAFHGLRSLYKLLKGRVLLARLFATAPGA